MPITINELKDFVGWLMVDFITEAGQRYVGPVTGAEKRKGKDAELTIIFMKWVMTDYSDEQWFTAIGDSGRPMMCWHCNFADWQSIQPGKDGAFTIDHSPAEQVIMFFPPDHPLTLKCNIVHIRNLWRWHRDQRGDDRCWIDDYRVYSGLPCYVVPDRLPAAEVCRTLCEQYHSKRSLVEGPPAVQLPALLDTDLFNMSAAELQAELAEWLRITQEHYDLGDGKRTAKDDNRVYLCLPEKLPADQRLPTAVTFLANCDKFVGSRGKPPQKLHEW